MDLIGGKISSLTLFFLKVTLYGDQGGTLLRVPLEEPAIGALSIALPVNLPPSSQKGHASLGSS